MNNRWKFIMEFKGQMPGENLACFELNMVLWVKFKNEFSLNIYIKDTEDDEGGFALHKWHNKY